MPLEIGGGNGIQPLMGSNHDDVVSPYPFVGRANRAGTCPDANGRLHSAENLELR
jgi:hypothetical protein